MVLIFYYDPMSPPCIAVHMTLKALNVPFEGKFIELFTAQQKSSEYLKINPRGKVPVIVDGSLTLEESQAILCYLCNKYATDSTQSLYPKEPTARAQVDKILYAGEWIQANIIQQYLNVRGVLFQGKQPYYDSLETVKECLRYVENCLKEHCFVASESLTIADISLETILARLELMDFDGFNDYSCVQNWMKRIKSLPFYNECNNTYSLQRLKKAYKDKLIV